VLVAAHAWRRQLLVGAFVVWQGCSPRAVVYNNYDLAKITVRLYPINHLDLVAHYLAIENDRLDKDVLVS